jgi:uncharacterized protein YfbU (UPF0304 family)
MRKSRDAKVILEFEGYQSYAQKAVINWLRHYIDVDGLEVGKRQKVMLPEDEFERATNLMETIRRFDLARFKGFRSEFDGIREEDPRGYLDALEEIVNHYATIRALQQLLK